MSYNLSDLEAIMLTPDERIKQLLLYSSKVCLNSNISIKKYYLSGQEMVRMADEYFHKNNLEQSYILYMQFMKLFLEKISDHPDYNFVPIEDRNSNNRLLREVLLKSEDSKNKLLIQYKNEYDLYLKQKELKNIREKREKETISFKNEMVDEDSKKTFNNIQITEENLNIILDNAAPPDLYDEFFNSLLQKPSINQGFVALNNSNKAFENSRRMFAYGDFIQCEETDIKKEATKNDSNNLRMMIVPGDLTKIFLEHSQKNTKKNLETFGILLGKESYNSFIITHLIIPKQISTSSSCSSTNDKDINKLKYQKSLITLGWIHIHPTQETFLSNEDLHVQYSYQCMLPEALAIVCAPQFKKNTFFHLTPNGLQVIASSKVHSGYRIFNLNDDIYNIAEHYILDNNLLVNIIDFRYY